MRKGYNSEFLKDDNGNLLGINLGSDFCAEHEWGIDGIRRRFAIAKDSSVLGIQRRMINNVPENLIYKEIQLNNKKYTVLILISPWALEYCNTKPEEEWVPNDLKPYKDDLVCAWDENTFGILVSDKFSKEISKLHDAFQRKDIAVGIAPSQVFNNGGLKFTIASKLSKEVVDDIYNNDIDAINLEKASEATGIHEILQKAGKNYYALSPRWKDKSKREVLFWLNPMEQHIHNFGWFTVDDLKEWANNKGKIMKK
jgi:hypothetical protein